MRSIDLTFNDDLDAAVRASWVALADGGPASLASHVGASNRPHVTLAAGEMLAVQSSISFEPFAIELGAIVLFPRKSGFVLARTVVPTVALLELHQRVHGGTTGAFAHTLPDRWTPHVTLSRRVSAEQLPAAMAALDEAGGPPLAGTAAAMRLWDSASASVTVLSAAASDLPAPVGST